MKFLSQITFLFFLLPFLTTSSCKKKKDSIKEDDQVPIQNIPAYSPAKINGYLLKSLDFNWSNDTLQLRKAVLDVAIYDTLISKDSILYLPFALDIGNVYLNDTLLQKWSQNNWYSYYNEWSPTFPLSPYKWKIKGNVNFPQIEFSDKSPLPVFKGVGSILDTLFLFKDNTLLVEKYSNADKIEVTIDGTNYGTGQSRTITKSIEPPQTTIEFKKNELTELIFKMVPYADIEVKLYRNNYQLINSKSLNFQTITVFRALMVPTSYN